jgi:hypothetical protein
MGKLKKKKIKRTPLQLQKIREKQNKKMLENQLKKEMLIKNNIEEQNNKMMDIMNQLTEDDWKDMWFHLTPTHRWEKIKDEGLKGGVGGKWGDDKGFLYLVDSDCKKLWNGIGSYHIMDFEEKDIRKRLGDKDYVVIGVPKKVFQILDCPLKEDMGLDMTNYNQNHRVVHLGNKVIHPLLFKNVYEGRTDINQYETVDRWEFTQKYFQRVGKDIPKSQLSLNDGVLGVIRYDERFEKTTNNFLKLSMGEMIREQQTTQRNHILMGSHHTFNTSPQQQKVNPMVIKNRKSYEEVV